MVWRAIWIGLLFAFACFVASFISGHVYAHDVWANGEKVPSWVKAACCGPEDVHHLRPDQIHSTVSPTGEKMYQIDGYPYPIAASQALPSQDGDYWIFYRDGRPQGGSVSSVYCLFIPMGF